jgi:hypothetical protein
MEETHVSVKELHGSEKLEILDKVIILQLSVNLQTILPTFSI